MKQLSNKKLISTPFHWKRSLLGKCNKYYSTKKEIERSKKILIANLRANLVVV